MKPGFKDMRIIDTFSGSGTVTLTDGKTVNVRYTVNVWQEDIPTGLGGTIPGMQTTTGSVTPFCGAAGEKLNLRMHDGRTLEFFFADANGKITGTGPIQDR